MKASLSYVYLLYLIQIIMKVFAIELMFVSFQKVKSKVTHCLINYLWVETKHIFKYIYHIFKAAYELLLLRLTSLKCFTV